MEHNEAVKQLATERYLLGEMSAEERETFEEHFFDCAECALDVRAGAAFVEEARQQLPEIARSTGKVERRNWLAWLTPAMAAPAFALLLAIIGYQNLATIPGLRSAAREPRVVPWTNLHVATRGGERATLQADRRQGAMLLLDLPPNAMYSSYGLQLEDAQGRPFWSQTVDAPQNGTPLSLLIPAAGLQQGSCTLNITGITPQGNRTPLDRRTLDVQFKQ